ncbi:MAG: alpha/beta hydrolase [Ketobacteraceae bacterium]|nr:alpha/beta hydrolase [Ketobacteraceae bacterium]
MIFKTVFRCALTLLLVSLSACKVQIPELPLDPEEEVAAFRDYYQNEVLPYFNAGEFGSFPGEDGIEIAYGYFPADNARGAIMMLHGLNETAIKYAELIYDLRELGLDIYIMEHRGHGNSGRILNGSDQERRKIYIRDFDNYIRDAKTFYDRFVAAKPYNSLYLFAHSVGGNVAAQYIEQYPFDFDAAVLSSPMMELLTTHPAKVPENIAYPLAKFLTNIGQGQAYALDMEEPDVLIDHRSPDKFEAEFLTKSWKRWTTYNEVIEQNQHLIAGGPGATWGITNGFGKEAYEASFKARSASEAAKIQIPVLMFQSGDDWIVGTRGQNTFASNAVNAPFFETVIFEDAYHEAYMERDEIRDELVSRTIAFIKTY